MVLMPLPSRDDPQELGYVMSGSRHKRMNAVRMRKENQVYSLVKVASLGGHSWGGTAGHHRLI